MVNSGEFKFNFPALWLSSRMLPKDAKYDSTMQPHTDRKLTGRKFEVFLALYLITHMLIQNYNIYKQNFYADNSDLIFFSSIMLTRRLFQGMLGCGFMFAAPAATAAAASAHTLPPGSSPHHIHFGASAVLRKYLSIVMGVLFVVGMAALVVYFLFKISLKQPAKHVAILFSPYIGHLLLNGWRRSFHSFFSFGALNSSSIDDNNSCVKSADWLSASSAGTKPVEGGEQSSMERSIWEVYFLNNAKELVITLGEVTLFTSIFPIKLLQNDHLFFDFKLCLVVMFYVFLNCSVVLCCYLSATSFYEMYIYARNLGSWQRTNADPSQTVLTWTAHKNYPRGCIVSHAGALFEAVDDPMNTSEPGNVLQTILHKIFAHPERTHTVLILVQGMAAVSLFIFVVQAKEWPMFAMMLMFNYYILWLCISTRREILSEIIDRTHSLRKVKQD